MIIRAFDKNSLMITEDNKTTLVVIGCFTVTSGRFGFCLYERHKTSPYDTTDRRFVIIDYYKDGWAYTFGVTDRNTKEDAF
ncbi:MAG: hypothetical protein WHV28_09595 [Bacteroidota bacterium]